MVFYLKRGVAPKNGPKVKKVGPNTKKTTLKLEYLENAMSYERDSFRNS